MAMTLRRQIYRMTMLAQQIRNENTMTNIHHGDLIFRPSLAQWTKTIREAEKIVGYPTSFMNLRWLLSDEFANLAMHLRKVVSSDHPVLQTAKTLIYNEQNNFQPWGLIILLLSKAMRSTIQNLETNSIIEKQRILAELTEMIRTGHYVHRSLLNIPVSERTKSAETALFGNKIAILTGDYLLVTANGMLAKIKNQELSYLISSALRDLSEGEFYGSRDTQNMPLPGKPIRILIDDFKITPDTLPLEVLNTLGSPTREWTLRTLYNGGSLFGRGCQGALLLDNHNLEIQEKAYLFGCHVCLAWQAASELKKFTSDNNGSYSLVSAPVLFAINDDPDLYIEIEKHKDNLTDLNYKRLKQSILKTSALKQTSLMHEKHMNLATNYVKMFGDNESLATIISLIKTV